MKVGKDNIEEILRLNIEDINKDKLYPIYKLWHQNDYLDFLDALKDYITHKLFFDDGDPSGDGYYLYDSDKVEFVKSKVIEWFGKSNGLALIDGEYWFLSYAFDDAWDISKIDTVDLENAKKLVKLMSIVDDIGDEIRKHENSY